MWPTAYSRVLDAEFDELMANQYKVYLQYKRANHYNDENKVQHDYMCTKLFQRTLTGKQFNMLFPDYPVKKSLPADMTSNGYVFKEGHNIDTRKFTIGRPCTWGGFYASPADEISKWLLYKNNLSLVADVSYPDDALIYMEYGYYEKLPLVTDLKFKSSEIILSNIQTWLTQPIICNIMSVYNVISWVDMNCCQKPNVLIASDTQDIANACTCNYCLLMYNILEMRVIQKITPNKTSVNPPNHSLPTPMPAEEIGKTGGKKYNKSYTHVHDKEITRSI